jgi:hypothetical protein
MVSAPCVSGIGGDGYPAIVKGCQKFAAVEVAADEDKAGCTLFRFPWANEIPFEHHVHGLQGEFPVVSCDGQDALGAQDVGAVSRQQALQPFFQPIRVQRLGTGQRYAGNACLLYVAAMVVSMIVIVSGIG